MPLKLGVAKVQEYTHTFIHFYDLVPVIEEIDVLHNHSNSLMDKIHQNSNYVKDTFNYIKLLNLLKEKVERKIADIIPNSHRVKRGLINGLGSIFKSITGNLDANDGEKYNRLIKDLQFNENKLAENIRKQNSISFDIINKFNDTILKIAHNEKLLYSKITQISEIVGHSINKENSILLKDTLTQIINMYEIVNSVLQDLENSISFSKLNTLHPSIIRTTDFYNELLKLQKRVKSDQFPLDVTLQNVLLIEKLATVNCFIFNNKITYLIHIPIVYPQSFEYFHLYSIPVMSKHQFKTIISNQKYLLKNELYYAYERNSCKKIKPQYYICDKLSLHEIDQTSPCEIQLINMKPINNSCRQTTLKLKKSIIQQLEKSDTWIGIFPKEEIIKLKCERQEEIMKVLGTFMVNIPLGCQIIANQEIIKNEEQEVNNHQPILFPQLAVIEHPTSPVASYHFEIEDIDLDELQHMKNRIVDNQPNTSFSDNYVTPSVWTIAIYVFVIIIILFFCYKKWFPNQVQGQHEIREHQAEQVEMSTVQLPR